MNSLIRKIKEKREINKLRSSAKNGSIEAAFTRRAKEIESLRQYDRGEKHITAPNLAVLVRSVSGSRR